MTFTKALETFQLAVSAEIDSVQDKLSDLGQKEPTPSQEEKQEELQKQTPTA